MDNNKWQEQFRHVNVVLDDDSAGVEHPLGEAAVALQAPAERQHHVADPLREVAATVRLEDRRLGKRRVPQYIVPK